MTLNRRAFLARGAAGAAGLVLGGPMQALVSRAALAQQGAVRAASSEGYGPLVPKVDKTTGEVLLHLPSGFQYRSFGWTGEVMDDGVPTPPKHDGMAAFPAGRGRVRLVRNHELFPRRAELHRDAFGDPQRAYDPQGGGGTTTLEVSAHGEQVRSWVSLNGTIANCAGGPTPWGTWISCEESTNGNDQNRNFRRETLTLQRPHGYLWEVPVSRGPGEYTQANPIRAAGRFAHEAVAVDPETGVVYLTQDNFGGPSGFYRYSAPVDPLSAGRLVDGGTLEILAVDGPQDLSGHVPDGSSYAVRWLPIPDPDPSMEGFSDDEGSNAVVAQGVERGAAIFSRIEGCWYGDRKVFFNSTQGGEPVADKSGFGDGAGQVWMYDLDTQRLTLLFESPGPDVLDMPDNLTFSPQGSLVLCEDSREDNYLRGLTLDGRVFDFALNRVPGHERDEWAGATFSPDGGTLFVNIQDPGVTFAIWGPWRRGPL